MLFPSTPSVHLSTYTESSLCILFEPLVQNLQPTFISTHSLRRDLTPSDLAQDPECTISSHVCIPNQQKIPPVHPKNFFRCGTLFFGANALPPVPSCDTSSLSTVILPFLFPFIPLLQPDLLMTSKFSCPYCASRPFPTKRGLSIHTSRYCTHAVGITHPVHSLVRNYVQPQHGRAQSAVPDQITVEQQADIFTNSLAKKHATAHTINLTDEPTNLDRDECLEFDDEVYSLQTDKHILPIAPKIVFGDYPSTAHRDGDDDPYNTFIDNYPEDDDQSSIASVHSLAIVPPTTSHQELDVGEQSKSATDTLPWRPNSGDGTIFYTSEPIPSRLHNVSIEVPSCALNPQIYRAALTPMDTLLLKIDLIFEKANCSAGVPDQIIKAVQESIIEDGVDFRTEQIPTFETFIRRMQKCFPSPQSQLVSVTLESPQSLDSVLEFIGDSNETAPEKSTPVDDSNRRPSKKSKTDKNRKKMGANKTYNVDQDLSYNRTQVVKFPFLEQVEDLLTDHTIFSDLDNFAGVIDPDNPFDEWGPKDGSLDEIVSGTWYHETYSQAKHIQDIDYPNEPFLVIPVILYMDKTGLDKSNRIAMEPVLLMLGILNRAARNKDNAKRLLGYLPDLELKSAAEKQVQRSTPEGLGRSCRNYHTVLDVGKGGGIQFSVD
jgi:hypothetical protein